MTNNRLNKHFLVSDLHGNLKKNPHQTRVPQVWPFMLICTIFSLIKVKLEARGKEFRKSIVFFSFFPNVILFDLCFFQLIRKRVLVQ